jgi:hypothetical protein
VKGKYFEVEGEALEQAIDHWVERFADIGIQCIEAILPVVWVITAICGIITAVNVARSIIERGWLL